MPASPLPEPRETQSLTDVRRILDGTQGITAQQAHDTAAIVIVDMLHDTPLLELVRIIASVRWGALGRTMKAQRRAALAKAQEPAHV